MSVMLRLELEQSWVGADSVPEFLYSEEDVP